MTYRDPHSPKDTTYSLERRPPESYWFSSEQEARVFAQRMGPEARIIRIDGRTVVYRERGNR